MPFQTDSESVDSRAVEAFCSGIACDVHVRLRMRGELEISFKAPVVTDLFAEQTLCSVSDLELVGACETGALISVYVPGEGDTVFEVARELNADPESIDADTFLQGEKVVVFRGAN